MGVDQAAFSEDIPNQTFAKEGVLRGLSLNLLRSFSGVARCHVNIPKLPCKSCKTPFRMRTIRFCISPLLNGL